eukprot:CAMPEP_0175483326 /NCGR_PEP_ID=MMETSP0095-20121207/79429_1 /TAXON_ID=311494 /ORGANISM="Alexandrium monilatum, Strain CCMP3105" /LENGTH=224 /DNA_ID=CAMNT_0016785029 /DNA_START=33 /DNA_END=705 /DNA_ORIENTATION=-
MEPPAQLIDEFQQMKDIPILSTMRQVGVVFLTAERSTNQPNEDEETAEIHKLSDKVVRLGEQGDYLKSWKAARKSLQLLALRPAPPERWGFAAAAAGQRAKQHGPAGFANVNETLLTCLEALASSVRYTSGTWMERKKLADFPEWVNAALAQMRRNGQKLAAPPLGWGSRQPLPRGGSGVGASGDCGAYAAQDRCARPGPFNRWPLRRLTRRTAPQVCFAGVLA